MLTEVLRKDADRLLRTVIDIELEYFLIKHKNNVDDHGRYSVVRNGYLPERRIYTGIGEITIRVPRVRDRSGSGINFRSKIVPTYLKKTNEFTELFPWSYLKGKQSGNFFEALQLLAGSNVFSLSEEMKSRLEKIWKKELNIWKSRSFTHKKYSRCWIEIVNPSEKFKNSLPNILLIIGEDDNKNKELLDLQFHSFNGHGPWKKLLTNLYRRGLKLDRDSIVENPPLSFWKAWNEIDSDEMPEENRFLNAVSNLS